MPYLQQITAILSVLALVASAVALWRPVSVSSRLRNRINSIELATSELELACDALKRQQKLLSNRQASADYRASKREMPFDGEGSVGEVPPLGTPKAELRRIYAKQLEMNRAGRNTQAAETK